eukprot:PhF_6_TR14981/c0_g1_i1/m.23543
MIFRSSGGASIPREDASPSSGGVKRLSTEGSISSTKLHPLTSSPQFPPAPPTSYSSSTIFQPLSCGYRHQQRHARVQSNLGMSLLTPDLPTSPVVPTAPQPQQQSPPRYRNPSPPNPSSILAELETQRVKEGIQSALFSNTTKATKHISPTRLSLSSSAAVLSPRETRQSPSPDRISSTAAPLSLRQDILELKTMYAAASSERDEAMRHAKSVEYELQESKQLAQSLLSEVELGRARFIEMKTLVETYRKSAETMESELLKSRTESVELHRRINTLERRMIDDTAVITAHHDDTDILRKALVVAQEDSNVERARRVEAETRVFELEARLLAMDRLLAQQRQQQQRAVSPQPPVPPPVFRNPVSSPSPDSQTQPVQPIQQQPPQAPPTPLPSTADILLLVEMQSELKTLRDEVKRMQTQQQEASTKPSESDLPVHKSVVTFRSDDSSTAIPSTSVPQLPFVVPKITKNERPFDSKRRFEEVGQDNVLPSNLTAVSLMSDADPSLKGLATVANFHKSLVPKE